MALKETIVQIMQQRNSDIFVDLYTQSLVYTSSTYIGIISISHTFASYSKPHWNTNLATSPKRQKTCDYHSIFLIFGRKKIIILIITHISIKFTITYKTYLCDIWSWHGQNSNGKRMNFAFAHNSLIYILCICNGCLIIFMFE